MARVGIAGAGLILILWPGVSPAQTVEFPPAPAEDVGEAIDGTVDKVENTVEGIEKGLSGRAESARDAVRGTGRAVRRTLSNQMQEEAAEQRETRTVPGAGSRRSRRQELTAQRENEGAEKDENGDVDRLVDAGKEIEGPGAKGARVQRSSRERGETMPWTGFEPRKLALSGAAMIDAGLLLLAMCRALHPVTRLGPS